MTAQQHSSDTDRDALRQRMTEQLDSVLAHLDKITDPAERELVARFLADELLPSAVRRVKVVRGGAVQELRADRTLREVAALLGLSVPRVDQLAKGK
ncbi:hypothetical protein [Streptomyces sp. Da 82-17]|uniref:hypothetical protein n=1 Tax=Streptomyces sp. Da 82-17 TaxID=3377116 RepID=UPI0038D51402